MTSWTSLNPGRKFLGCDKYKVIMALNGELDTNN